MLSSDPFFPASSGHSASLQTSFPPQAYRPPRSPDRHRSQHLRSLIADAMRQLPFEHRAVIYRAHYQRWTTARIADDLQITEADVKSRLHDGLHALQLAFRDIERRRGAH